MSFALQCLLRLPGCIRSQALLETIPQRTSAPRYNITGAITRRAFSTGPQALRAAKNSRPPPVKPSASRSPPLAASIPPSTATGKPKSYAEALLEGGREILIYKAPSHRTFAITSYILGGIFVAGAWNQAMISTSPIPGEKQDEQQGIKKYLLQSTVLFTAIFLAGAGTAMILAPQRMIKAIRARSVTLGGGSPHLVLRCEMENPMPFMSNRSIEVRPSEALLDRKVSAEDIDFTSVPLSAAQAFTTSPKPHAEPLVKPSSNPITRGWNALRRDTRRMFYRDGFAFVRFPDYGSWKLDLQNCELLDNGRALERFTVPDPDKGRGLVYLFRRKYFI